LKNLQKAKAKNVQKNTKKKFSLDNLSRKQFNVLRISIYLLGIFIVLGFIVSHVLQLEVISFNNLEIKNQDRYTTIDYFSRKDHSKITLSFKLEEDTFERLDTDKTSIKAIRTLSPLLRKHGNIIAEEKELSERMFKKNETSVSNGNIISTFFSKFYIEQGSLRKIADEDIRNIFKTNKFKTKKLAKDDFQKLGIGELLTSEDLKKDSHFPKDLIIESGGKFYITGANTLHPIFSKKLISKINPEFSFISGISPSEANMQKMQCSKDPEMKSLICKTSLKEISSSESNVYHFEITGIQKEDITESRLDFGIEKTFDNYFKRFKELFW